MEDIKAEFKINITYKQSHKLIFAVFPGTSSRVENPVKIEADGDFYSYKGIAPKSKIGQDQKVNFLLSLLSICYLVLPCEVDNLAKVDN